MNNESFIESADKMAQELVKFTEKINLNEEDMLDFIGNELALANFHFKPSVSAKIGESDRLACYQINNLISYTFKQEEIIVYKAKNNDKSRGTM